jgi:hypothetical protein
MMPLGLRKAGRWVEDGRQQREDPCRALEGCRERLGVRHLGYSDLAA